MPGELLDPNDDKLRRFEWCKADKDVHDAIIDIENVVRRLRQQQKEGRGKSLRSMARTILEASLEVRGAIVYATMIEVVAILPVFFMESLAGAFFKPDTDTFMLCR